MSAIAIIRVPNVWRGSRPPPREDHVVLTNPALTPAEPSEGESNVEGHRHRPHVARLGRRQLTTRAAHPNPDPRAAKSTSRQRTPSSPPLRSPFNAAVRNNTPTRSDAATRTSAHTPSDETTGTSPTRCWRSLRPDPSATAVPNASTIAGRPGALDTYLFQRTIRTMVPEGTSRGGLDGVSVLAVVERFRRCADVRVGQSRPRAWQRRSAGPDAPPQREAL